MQDLAPTPPLQRKGHHATTTHLPRPTTANLMYGLVLGDPHNEQLRLKWDELIHKTNTQNSGARTLQLQLVGSLPGPFNTRRHRPLRRLPIGILYLVFALLPVSTP